MRLPRWLICRDAPKDSHDQLWFKQPPAVADDFVETVITTPVRRKQRKDENYEKSQKDDGFGACHGNGAGDERHSIC